ncbi:hypothetical protein SDC9_110302 [bioreactor metagenome]|uniref:Uncharacterized protein n=1 Tax=bioreactor metagenome TaxID=1076179 RepID=A0A645BDL9_9ZZZZ
MVRHLKPQTVNIAPERIDCTTRHLKHLSVLSLLSRSHDIFKALVDAIDDLVLAPFSEFLVSSYDIPYLVGDIHFYRLVEAVCLAHIGYDEVIANHLDNKRAYGYYRRCYHQKDDDHVGNLYSLFYAPAFEH